MWLNIAAANGYKNAVKLRDMTAARLDAKQLIKAQELIRNCINKKYQNCTP